ncbi:MULTISPECIES: efflux transporter outer membrane subunit [Pseudomonas]|jgi:NodT family efflux transporter outer membrane factor (OMF) lipoprotein|uniref:Efflux transporter outer membrane subunit n=1 Tax=Pseudomonas soli TaxID=1306993 RepID=A0A1H9EYL6_9PSED|nr:MULTISPECIES: efflux transporter outer membrane subunit [Pseudomonas]AUY32954.1 RND transporter [Pseudomonas sp. PONIH3]MCX5510337.1 efflux transporter outer membrane subunit [Pseudomonas sp. BJa3]MDT3713076.1 efflux transporter outer membrane subunit [Pseudomonas soli]MDT3730412.1 efflux transporter outer membrane subunit [Pseudomonas soli]MEE1879441.1 efflux transporter outer membrane subunit [Pseudomonas soli]
MTIPCRISLLALSLGLAACSTPPPPAANIDAPAAWQGPTSPNQALPDNQWWRAFASLELDRLVERARSNSHDLAAAAARVRKAQAIAVIAGAPLLPEVQLGLDGSRQRLLRGEGNRQLDASSSERTSTSFGTRLSASYEIDFWGGLRATRDSALRGLDASRFDRQTVELTLVSAVADSYLQSLALDEQLRIAQLNLDNARDVLGLVEARERSGSATRLELAQQRSLVAAQERQLPLLEQRRQDNRIVLATLLGDPVQALPDNREMISNLQWPSIGSGVPSELLGRRPDIAAAEARLAAASANIQVARAAMLPRLILGANLGSGARTLPNVLDSPYYTLTAGLAAPIFNNGRLSAARDQASAEQEELLELYRGSILAGFADVEKALNAVAGVERQRRWQDQEVEQARVAFELAQQRYAAGAETLLTVLETQRTLYLAQDQQAQLRLEQLQGSVALYKALGGGWQTPVKL